MKAYCLLMQAVTAAVEHNGGTLERLTASSKRLAVLDEERRAEQSRRDALILEARDTGNSWRTISRSALCSMSRCVAIVGGG